MKVLSVATALLAGTVSAGFGFSTSKDVEVKPLDDSLSVPGDNPLVHCANPKGDLLDLKSVDLSPNPPSAGTVLKVTAKGDLAEDIEEGAVVHLSVKYGMITLIKQDADLCDSVKNVDLTCPIKKGETELTKEVELPKQIPPGKYTVFADVETKDKKKITCLTAIVAFSRGGAVSVEGGWKQGL